MYLSTEWIYSIYLNRMCNKGAESGRGGVTDVAPT